MENPTEISALKRRQKLWQIILAISLLWCLSTTSTSFGFDFGCSRSHSSTTTTTRTITDGDEVRTVTEETRNSNSWGFHWGYGYLFYASTLLGWLLLAYALYRLYRISRELDRLNSQGPTLQN